MNIIMLQIFLFISFLILSLSITRPDFYIDPKSYTTITLDINGPSIGVLHVEAVIYASEMDEVANSLALQSLYVELPSHMKLNEGENSLCDLYIRTCSGFESLETKCFGTTNMFIVFEERRIIHGCDQETLVRQRSLLLSINIQSTMTLRKHKAVQHKFTIQTTLGRQDIDCKVERDWTTGVPCSYTCGATGSYGRAIDIRRVEHPPLGNGKSCAAIAPEHWNNDFNMLVRFRPCSDEYKKTCEGSNPKDPLPKSTATHELMFFKINAVPKFHWSRWIANAPLRQMLESLPQTYKACVRRFYVEHTSDTLREQFAIASRLFPYSTRKFRHQMYFYPYDKTQYRSSPSPKVYPSHHSTITASLPHPPFTYLDDHVATLIRELETETNVQKYAQLTLLHSKQTLATAIDPHNQFTEFVYSFQEMGVHHRSIEMKAADEPSSWKVMPEILDGFLTDTRTVCERLRGMKLGTSEGELVHEKVLWAANNHPRRVFSETARLVPDAVECYASLTSLSSPSSPSSGGGMTSNSGEIHAFGDILLAIPVKRLVRNPGIVYETSVPLKAMLSTTRSAVRMGRILQGKVNDLLVIRPMHNPQWQYARGLALMNRESLQKEYRLVESAGVGDGELEKELVCLAYKKRFLGRLYDSFDLFLEPYLSVRESWTSRRFLRSFNVVSRGKLGVRKSTGDLYEVKKPKRDVKGFDWGDWNKDGLVIDKDESLLDSHKIGDRHNLVDILPKKYHSMTQAALNKIYSEA